jgi:hypothetical protein
MRRERGGGGEGVFVYDAKSRETESRREGRKRERQ